MSRYWSLALSLLLFCAAVHAETSLRVGSKVLTLGDSAVRVQQLLGQPTVRALSHAHVGGVPDNQLVSVEQWQYAQDGKTILITIHGGRVANIETLYE
ncbi:DUF2845 domain-containing protein [Dyella dinghuensis]|uniref:DUF2845 domain-containing protein n=1 Tax=Dyella dinghuensis TaxID=1920169 RepID=UPI001F180DDA|nr:DUF2845 domain-containing protein [Dyella dinghuensis]